MYHEEKRGWMKHLDFTLIDLAALEAALTAAYFWRFGSWIFYSPLFMRLAYLVALVDIVVVFFAESYSGILRRTKYKEATATIVHVISVFGGVLLINYATKVSERYSRPLFFLFFFLAIFFEYGGRVVWKRKVRKRMLEGHNKAMMLVVADSTTVERCLYEISHSKYTDFVVQGVVVVDVDMRGESIQGIPVVATADTFWEYVRTAVVDEVFIDGNTRASSEALASELVELGLTVHIAMVHTDKMIPNRIMESYANYMVLTTSMKIASVWQMTIKRLMDILGGVVGMVFTVLFTIIFGPIIKLQSPGPIFYSSIRIGKGGRRFTFYKFRTMVMDADKMLDQLADKNRIKGQMFKMDNDPRIIPIGRFMRKYSIDEFPQFWNVLKGEMSLVGTRPPTEREFEQYERRHKARLGIKPGLTGMWQTSGRNEIDDFEKVVELDTEYIMNWSLGLDLMILFKTIAVVFKGEGAQ